MDKYKFGKTQLIKQGWSEGKGLGKLETGMKDAIKVKLKHDTAGVGHDAGEEFSFHWWSHVYNKAASNIEVDNSEDTVNVKQSSEFSISKKKTEIKGTFANKSMLYGRFIKSATLMGDSLVEEEKSSSESDSEPEIMDQELCPDEVLFKKCGGRTAHKAARHGLGLNGKLLRIEQQEKLAESLNNTPAQSDENGEVNSNEKKKKKKKKKKSEKEIIEKEEMCEIPSKKKNKKNKHKSIDKEDNIEVTIEENGSEENEIEDNLEIKKKKKKKSKKSKKTELNEEEEIVTVNELKDSKKKSKKKKRKRNNSTDDSEDETKIIKKNKM